MKIRCVDNTDQELALTIGKIYDAKNYDNNEYNDFYHILSSDTGVSGGYSKYRFIELKLKEERKNKLEKLNLL